MTYRPGMRIGVWAAVFAGAALAAWPSTAAAQGTGLWADYYDALDFSGVVSSRTDATVDFPDFASPPAPGLTNDETFVVRWQGRVQAPAGLAAGSVITFYLRTDDGGRLWVDGRLVIDQWEQQGVPAQPGPSGTVTTTGGQFHNVRVEQYEQNGGDGAVLEWSYTGQTQQVVPQVNLFPQAAAVRILPNGGTFTNSVTVRLGVDTLGKPGQAVVVRYTTNGSDINAETDGIAYTGPFVLIGNATVKARIFRSDMPTPAGPQVQASFTVSD
ncbi:MAG TPA: PA14 domain-containing protein, partial [Planctomycetota bacterium]|nr:PA14 domain-containing protein [Planctomycetota bacterium]